MKLIQHVLDIRSLIQKAFENRFDRLGLKVSGQQPIDLLADNRRDERKRLDNIIADHIKNTGNYALAREEAIRECVFTLFNRIAAIKVMEDRELFPEIIRRRTEHAGRSFAHNAWLEENPDERRAEREGLKHFLNDKFIDLSDKLPIFKAEYPYSLMPTADELYQIIEAFNAVEKDADCGEDIWKGDDILGWLYENFNAVEKQAHKDSGEKTEYHKVSLQSQVYTPKWVVKFLVDNTLVKYYLEMFPDSSLRNKYQVANAPEPSPFAISGRSRKKLEDMKLIDPGMGSGNFLLYAFEVFYDLYQNQNEQYKAEYSNRDIPRLILENNIYGLDLDERAAQLTQISLYIKAWTLGGRRFNKPSHLNVVSTHFTLPEFEDIEMALQMGDGWQEYQMDSLRKVWSDLRNAYKFGSLIRVEETFDKLLPVDANDLFANEWKQEMFSFKRIAIEKLRQQLSCISGNPYSLSKVNDALTYLEILLNKFDVAVSNPPYTDSGDFGVELKEFIEENYKEPYKFNINLYAAFICRCCELAGEIGKVGMVNPPTFMYIKTFQDVRQYILTQSHINLFVEWGYLGMFSSFARVDSAMFILEKDKNLRQDKKSVFIKLNDLYEMKRKDMLFSAYTDLMNNVDNSRVYKISQLKFWGIDSCPFIYWISNEFRRKFDNRALGKSVDTCKGMDTSCNERFLRFFWEVDPNDISTDYKTDKKKWVRYAKGGPYNKWYGNFWLTVNWNEDGKDLIEFKDAKGKTIPNLRNKDKYFQEGITYSASGSKGTTFRYMPSNTIIDSGGPGIYGKTFHDLYYILGLLNSNLVAYICSCLNPTVNTTHGDLRRIPFVTARGKIKDLVSDLAKQNTSIKKDLCKYCLYEENFEGSPITPNNVTTNAAISSFFDLENAYLTLILLNESIINSTLFRIYELSESDKQMVLDKEGIPVGDLPVSMEAKQAYREWLDRNSAFPANDEVKQHVDSLEVRTDIPRITDFETLYTNNKEWEVFCIQHNMNPVEVWYQFRNTDILPPQRTQVLAFELITDVIRSVLAKDDDGVVPIVTNTGEEQLALRIEAELIERGYQPAHISQLFTLLGTSLDKYLSERLFAQLSDYLNLFMYLPKTPFIWHITSGEHHALELYISIYKWNRDTLYRLKSVYAGNREDALKDRLSVLESKADVNAKMEAEEVRLQLRELKSFCDKVDDLLASGYDPKLDDGVGKNIAPLQKRKMLSYDVLNAGQLKKYLNADW